MFLLHLLRWLRKETKQEFELLLGRGGSLEQEFAMVTTVHTPQSLVQRPDLFREFGLIYSNTCFNGPLLESLPYGDTPIVTHVHELDYGINAAGAKNIAQVLRQTNHYFACTKMVARRLCERFRISEERISVHYEMVSTEAVTVESAEESAETHRKQYDIPKDAFVVTGCGTMDLRKAPDLFIQVAAQLHRKIGHLLPLRFFWIGKSHDPALDRTIRHDIQRLGLQAQIKFVGELAAPHGLLALSDLFCVTSREDPFPLVMLEAAALAKPILCFDGAGGAVEFCASGGGFVVPYLDTAAMADKCGELMKSSALLKEAGHKGEQTVRTRFIVETIAPALWADLESLLKYPPPMSPHRKGNSSLGEIFKSWFLEEAPDRSYIEAHLARQSVRNQARQLLIAGRRQEAIQTLLRAVRVDGETKDATIILECLVEIGTDLAPLDAAKARYIQNEAEKMARQFGVRLESIASKLSSDANAPSIHEKRPPQTQNVNAPSTETIRHSVSSV